MNIKRGAKRAFPKNRTVHFWANKYVMDIYHPDTKRKIGRVGNTEVGYDFLEIIRKLGFSYEGEEIEIEE